MKEEWKVFIRGNKDRGEEVIKVLEDCGASNSCGYIGDDTMIYFVRHDGIIDFVCEDTEYSKVIMDNYTELHLPEKWKDGDVLYIQKSKTFVVFKRYAYMDENGVNHFDTYFSVDENSLHVYGTQELEGYPILATPQEIDHFRELLHKHGKEWDAEKKQVVDWEWEPKVEERYYSVDVNGDVTYYTWDDDDFDAACYNFGNCFKTKEEAEAMAEKIKKLLKGE